MENTLMSHELEEMRSQITALKEKLDKQTIVNDLHIRNSMKSKANSMNRTISGTVAAGIFALIYCPICFSHLGCSVPFVIVTTVMLALCLILTVRQKRLLDKVDFSLGNLVGIAEALGHIRKHYTVWPKIVAPMFLVPWFAWCIYEFSKLNELGGMVVLVCAVVGGIIGGIIGFSIDRKVVRQTDDILSQIAELQKDH